MDPHSISFADHENHLTNGSKLYNSNTNGNSNKPDEGNGHNLVLLHRNNYISSICSCQMIAEIFDKMMASDSLDTYPEPEINTVYGRGNNVLHSRKNW